MMELSLVSSEGGSAAAAGRAEPGQPPQPSSLIAMPSAVNEFLQLALGGPGPPSEAKARLWATMVFVHALAMSYVSTNAGAVDPALAGAGFVCGVGNSVLGAALATSVHLRWRRLYCIPRGEDHALAFPEQGYRLRDLLDAEVTPDAAATGTKRVKRIAAPLCHG